VKVVHINLTSGSGGAGRAMVRLHEGLLRSGVESEIWPIVRDTFSDEVIKLPRWSVLTAKFNRRICRSLKRFLGLSNLGVLSFGLMRNTSLVKYINDSDADIVHLHWVQCEMLSIGDIGRIKKPIVWTLHDLWPFLGLEHYPGQIKGRNEKLAGNWLINWIDSSLIRRKRSKCLDNSTFIAPSAWAADFARSQSYPSQIRIEVIPNALDTDHWTPSQDKLEVIRSNYIEDRPILVFGAVGADTDPRKGYDLLVEAFRVFADRNPDRGVRLCLFGGHGDPQDFQSNIELCSLGKITNDQDLKNLYRSAAAVLVPSRQETFGQTALEANACGAPVVGFRTSGLIDIISHKNSGFLADPFDVASFALGIEWSLRNEAREDLAQICYEQANKFNSFDVAQLHMQLYEQHLN
jgi:glycosyltransferase involved in cell wall biosynthesis